MCFYVAPNLVISYNHNWFNPNEDYKIPDKEIVMKDYFNGKMMTNVILKRWKRHFAAMWLCLENPTFPSKS